MSMSFSPCKSFKRLLLLPHQQNWLHSLFQSQVVGHEMQNFLSPTAYCGGENLWRKETLGGENKERESRRRKIRKELEEEKVK